MCMYALIDSTHRLSLRESVDVDSKHEVPYRSTVATLAEEAHR